MTAKGQVTLRREVLEHLGVAPGDRITVDFLPTGAVEIRAAKAPGSIEDFIGCLKRPGTPTLSIDQINDVIAQGWAGTR